MLQMVGVIILALGIPPMFASIDAGDHVDNRVLVAGYVVMRIAMVFQWLRAARQDPAAALGVPDLRRAPSSSRRSAGSAAIRPTRRVPTTFLIFAVLVAGRAARSVASPRRRMGGTPWHAHHIAERYGLLVIIALGEGVVGTVASSVAVVGEQGWTMDARPGRGRRDRP